MMVLSTILRSCVVTSIGLHDKKVELENESQLQSLPFEVIDTCIFPYLSCADLVNIALTDGIHYQLVERYMTNIFILVIREDLCFSGFDSRILLQLLRCCRKLKNLTICCTASLPPRAEVFNEEDTHNCELSEELVQILLNNNPNIVDLKLVKCLRTDIAIQGFCKLKKLKTFVYKPHKFAGDNSMTSPLPYEFQLEKFTLSMQYFENRGYPEGHMIKNDSIKELNFKWIIIEDLRQLLSSYTNLKVLKFGPEVYFYKQNNGLMYLAEYHPNLDLLEFDQTNMDQNEIIKFDKKANWKKIMFNGSAIDPEEKKVLHLQKHLTFGLP